MFCRRDSDFVRNLAFWLKIEIVVGSSLRIRGHTPLCLLPVRVQRDTMFTIPLFPGKLARQNIGPEDVVSADKRIRHQYKAQALSIL